MLSVMVFNNFSDREASAREDCTQREPYRWIRWKTRNPGLVVAQHATRIRKGIQWMDHVSIDAQEHYNTANVTSYDCGQALLSLYPSVSSAPCPQQDSHDLLYTNVSLPPSRYMLCRNKAMGAPGEQRPDDRVVGSQQKQDRTMRATTQTVKQ